MKNKKFMTLEEYEDEYGDEYIKSGVNIDILEFLKRKKQEALEAGDQELAEHIETIYNEAYEEEKFNDQCYEEELQYAEDLSEELEETTPETMISEELESMSEEELQQIIDNNEQTIEENNKVLKRALVERILAQQRTISEQQLEISKLNSQKKEL